MTARIRPAIAADIAAIWAVRYAVHENTLRRGAIGDEAVRRAIEVTGRGWVVVDDADGNPAGGPPRVLAFAIAVVDLAAREGNVWALFVHPEAQGQGHGKALYAVMMDWLQAQGLRRLWLGTGPGTQALGFYQRRGWTLSPVQDDGEDLVLELWPATAPPATPAAGIR